MRSIPKGIPPASQLRSTACVYAHRAQASFERTTQSIRRSANVEPIFAKAKSHATADRVVPTSQVKTMTISKSLHRLSITTRIFGTLVAGAVLLAGMNAAAAKGGSGGGGNHSSGMMGNNHMSGGNSWSGKSNRAIIERQLPTKSPPIISKGNNGSKKEGKESRESRRELRKEYKKELREKIAELKRIERCKVFGKCGGIGKLPPKPVPVIIGKPILNPTRPGAPGAPTTTGGGDKAPVLSDPGYGKPGTGGTPGGGGAGSPGKIDDPSPGTTIKPF